MNTRYDTEHDLQDLESDEQDREISLSTTTILGIFFALALICAVFFGFGYSMGRKSAQPVAEVTTGSSAKAALGATATTPVPAIKPAAGTTQTATVPMDAPNDTAQQTQPASPPPSTKLVAANPGPAVPAEPAIKPATKPVVAVPVAAVSPTGTLVVQVAAMSHQEDADVVAVDLKRRGYVVAIRREPQDKLFHVQIGPFATKKEADGMRQRLQTDGYNNAIVK